jgi:hypothetical protein
MTENLDERAQRVEHRVGLLGHHGVPGIRQHVNSPCRLCASSSGLRAFRRRHDVARTQDHERGTARTAPQRASPSA